MPSQISDKKLPLILFIVGTSFWFFLLQNLPFTFGDDLNVIAYANQHSWKELILAFINPLTPGMYVHGEACLSSTRAFEPLIFRILFSIAGYSPNAFWILKSVSMSLVSTLIFVLVRNTTGRNLMGLISYFFFLTACAVYRGVAWIADLEIIAQVGTLLSVFFFLKIYQEKDNKRLLWLILMILSYWIGMKVKETGRLFPIFTLGFIALDQNFNIWTWLKKNYWLVGVLILLGLTIFPFGHAASSALDTESKEATRHFDLNNLKLVLWSNPLSNHTPADLAKIFKWFLLLPGLFCVLWSLMKKNSAMIYFSVWFLLTLLGTCMGFHLKGNERYLTVILVPATLLIFSGFGLVLNQLGLITSKIVSVVILVLSIISIQNNFSSLIFLRNFYNSFSVADWKGTRAIYKDRFGKEPTWSNLSQFYRESKGDFSEIRIKEWDPSVPSDPASVKKVAQKWGAAYVLSFKEGLYPTVLLASDTSNRSLYSKIMPKIKKKACKKFFVYKITA